MRVLIFDTETTSLLPVSIASDVMQPRLIEFYGCIVNDADEVEAEYETLVNPGHKLLEETTKITGLTDEDLLGRPSFAGVADDIDRMLLNCDMVVAHNLSYDMGVLDVEFGRLGRRPSWPALRLCTVEQTVFLKGIRLNLSALHEHLFGNKFEGAHRARVDVQALVRCFCHLRKEELV